MDPETGRIDYDECARIAREVKPKMITSGASAYPRVIDFPRLRAIADEVGALLLADIAHIAGLVAAGEHPVAGRPRPHRHDHHAQDPARPARRPDHVRRRVRQGH